jgi:secreted PhoX family phosphatase
MTMSYLTDEARAAAGDYGDPLPVPENSLERLVAANPARRHFLQQGLGVSIASLCGGSVLLSGCGGEGTPTPSPAPSPPPPPPVSYAIGFTPVAANILDSVTVPPGYVAQPFFSAGDPVVAGAIGWTGTVLPSSQTELNAGGGHDGMAFFPIAGADPARRGLLAINHEFADSAILFDPGFSYNPATATAEQKQIALSAVGVSIIEVQRATDGKWDIVRNSPLNKRHSGNSVYRMSGPATALTGPSITGTLNNCSNGTTPWGTYLSCEETTSNYLDPTRAALGYGWVVEIDPLNELAPPTKRTAMGRFAHEAVAYLADSANRTAFYMSHDSAPGCIYKFVPSSPFSSTNRRANIDLLDSGTLYAARFNADGSGEWRELTQGKNGLIASTDPTRNFATQADVLVSTAIAAQIAGCTVMDRPEGITIGSDGTILCALTNNAARNTTDPANPRIQNLHGHIVRMQEANGAPLATTFRWDVFLLCGDPSLATAQNNLVGNIPGDSFASPDGIRIDPQGRIWVQTDMTVPGDSGVAGRTNEAVFGNNAMYNLDPVSKQSRRFLVGARGCEITGLTYTPDLMTFFINIQHPASNWPTPGKTARSTTIAVYRTDGKPVGA